MVEAVGEERKTRGGRAVGGKFGRRPGQHSQRQPRRRCGAKRRTRLPRQRFQDPADTANPARRARRNYPDLRSALMEMNSPVGPNALDAQGVVGKPLDRVDGRLKVTGGARYAYEMQQNTLYGFVVEASIGK